jgi:hypothetical protein
MGMSDTQFKGLLRLLVRDLKSVKEDVENNDTKEAVKQIDEILSDLQTTLED